MCPVVGPYSYSESGFAFFAGRAATLLAACTILKRIAPCRRLVIAHASDRQQKERPHIQCGDKLKARVVRRLDDGLLLSTADRASVFIHNPVLLKEKEEYKYGDEVKVTIVRLPASDGAGKKNLKFTAFHATDRPLKPLKSLRIGSIVDGRVLHISSHGVLLDIDVPRCGYAPWRYLEPLGKNQLNLSIGDTIVGLKVRSINLLNVVVGSASLEVLRLKDLKVGEKVKGYVVNIVQRLNMIFFDIGATGNAAALGRKNQLAKGIQGYTVGDQTQLEIVKVAGGKINVKDLGHRPE